MGWWNNRRQHDSGCYVFDRISSFLRFCCRAVGLLHCFTHLFGAMVPLLNLSYFIRWGVSNSPSPPNPFGNSNELFPFGTFFEECFLQGKGVCTPFALFV